MKKIVKQTTILKSTAYLVLKKYRCHPYKSRPVQGLHGNDSTGQTTFCDCFVNKCQEISDFQGKVLWRDEMQLQYSINITINTRVQKVR